MPPRPPDDDPQADIGLPKESTSQRASRRPTSEKRRKFHGTRFCVVPDRGNCRRFCSQSPRADLAQKPLRKHPRSPPWKSPRPISRGHAKPIPATSSAGRRPRSPPCQKKISRPSRNSPRIFTTLYRSPPPDDTHFRGFRPPNPPGERLGPEAARTSRGWRQTCAGRHAG